MLRIAALFLLGFLDGSTESTSLILEKKEEPISYEVAYQKAQKERKPLLILVGADWCHACKVMKEGTINQMKSSGQLKEVVYTQLDKEQHPELASQVMQGNTLPQIIVFCESDNGWRKFSLTGMQSERRVKELISRAVEVLPTRR